LLLAADEKLDYKRSVADKVLPAEKAKNVVLQPRHHFLVIRSGVVALDHVFNASGSVAPATPPTVLPNNGNVNASSSVTLSSPPTNAPGKGTVDFTAGPLSISALTLQYKEQGNDKVLALSMDAIFSMGPISFSLLGFGLSIPLKDLKLNDLSGLFGNVKPDLRGLAIAFNKPPLLIAGGFEHQFIGTDEIFMGGIGISFPPYTFVGVGEYEILNGFKSVFLYAKLDGRKYTL
jgi:hypothetical protein